MKRMIIWGATGQAKVLREAMQNSGWELIALFDRNTSLTPLPGIPLYFGRQGFERWLAESSFSEPPGFLVAIGGSRGKDRIEIHNYLESHQLKPLICQHATAFVADSAQIGAGSQILANASICVETEIGSSCIINTGAIIDHECRIADGVHICPGANLAGCVEVARYATIGTGAVVLPRIKIAEGAIIGAGAVVTKDVTANTVVVGNPARVIEKD